jgi:arginine decarboxylase
MIASSKFGFFLPTRYFLVVGHGDARWPAVAFDQALTNAGVSNLNLVQLTSVLAPGLQRIEPLQLAFGGFVGVAYAKFVHSHVGTMIAAGIAIAHPEDRSQASIIMEFAGICSAKQAEQQAIEMARGALEARNLPIKRVESTCVEHTVSQTGCVFAGVVEI